MHRVGAEHATRSGPHGSLSDGAQQAVATCLLAPLLLLVEGRGISDAELSQRMTPLAAQAADLEHW